MGAVVLLLQLLAGEDRLVAVDDDDMVAAVHIGGEGDLVLAAQQHGGFGGNAAEGLARGVDHIPLALGLGGFGESSAHLLFLLIFFSCQKARECGLAHIGARLIITESQSRVKHFFRLF